MFSIRPTLTHMYAISARFQYPNRVAQHLTHLRAMLPSWETIVNYFARHVNQNMMNYFARHANENIVNYFARHANEKIVDYFSRHVKEMVLYDGNMDLASEQQSKNTVV